MNLTSSVAPTPSPFFAQVRDDVRLYANVLCILDKIESDSYLTLLSSALQFIFQKEFIFAVSGKLSRVETIEGNRVVEKIMKM